MRNGIEEFDDLALIIKLTDCSGADTVPDLAENHLQLRALQTFIFCFSQKNEIQGFLWESVNEVTIKKLPLNHDADAPYRYTGGKPEFTLGILMKKNMHPILNHRLTLISFTVQCLDGIKAQNLNKGFPGVVCDPDIGGERIVHILDKKPVFKGKLADKAKSQAGLVNAAPGIIHDFLKAKSAVLHDQPGGPLCSLYIFYDDLTYPFYIKICSKKTDCRYVVRHS